MGQCVSTSPLFRSAIQTIKPRELRDGDRRIICLLRQERKMNIDNIKNLVTDSIAKSSNRFELWKNILNGVERRNVCEVGVWRGDFAKYILDHVHGIKEYIFVDPWQNLPNWNKPANVSNEKFEKIRDEAFQKNEQHASRIRELRMTTKEAATKIAPNSIDFAYIDGDHTLRGITIDLNSILPCIKENGLIGGDDFSKNIWQHSDKFDPSEVFPYAVYFSEAHNLTIFTLPFNQFLIVKNDVSEIVDLANYGELTPRQIYGMRKRAHA